MTSVAKYYFSAEVLRGFLLENTVYLELKGEAIKFMLKNENKEIDYDLVNEKVSNLIELVIVKKI